MWPLHSHFERRSPPYATGGKAGPASNSLIVKPHIHLTGQGFFKLALHLGQ